MFFGNKFDLEEKRIITFNQGEEFADSYGYIFMEISAKKNLNVNKSFEMIGRELMLASGENKIVTQKQNKKINVSKSQDLMLLKVNNSILFIVCYLI